ncbi:MAG: hypothetical protein R3C19_04430 [Planctomycetaceae bacterium]
MRKASAFAAARIISISFIALFAGCEYDRAFMQMDSNSGSPFLGWQLRVDASDRRRNTVSDSDRIRLADSAAPEATSRGPIYLATSGGRQTVRLVPTALATEFTSSVQYSLPEHAATGQPDQSAEVESIFRRMSAF